MLNFQGVHSLQSVASSWDANLEICPLKGVAYRHAGSEREVMNDDNDGNDDDNKKVGSSDSLVFHLG